MSSKLPPNCSIHTKPASPTNPVLIDEDDRIIAGHGRVKAAKSIGMTDVPTVRLTDMTEVQLRAYVIADNRLAENAGWDRELLALELQSLSEFSLEIGEAKFADRVPIRSPVYGVFFSAAAG